MMRLGTKAAGILAGLTTLVLVFGALAKPVAAVASTLDPSVCETTLDSTLDNPSPLMINEQAGTPIGENQGQFANLDDYTPGQALNNIALPFQISTYGQFMQIEPNGAVFIGDGSWGDGYVPSTSAEYKAFSLFHTDLDTTVTGNIFYGSCVVDDNGAQYDAYSVTWQGATYFGATEAMTMQLLFIDEGNGELKVVRNYESIQAPSWNMFAGQPMSAVVSGPDVDSSTFYNNMPWMNFGQDASLIVDGGGYALSYFNGGDTGQHGRYIWDHITYPPNYCDPTANTNLGVTYSAPGVEAVNPNFQSVHTQNFDSFSTHNNVESLPNGYQDSVGTWNGVNYTHAAGTFWGAGGVGASGVMVDETLTAPANTCYKYLGFWWAAGSVGNDVQLLDSNGTVLATFTARDLYDSLKLDPNANDPCPDTSNPYCGRTGSINPTDPNATDPQEPWAYVNLRFPAGFSSIRFYQSTGGLGFEIDNVSLSDVLPAVDPSENSLAQPIQVTPVTYHSNDGTGNYEVVSQVFSGSLSHMMMPSWRRFGYRFMGWSSDPSATTPDTATNLNNGPDFYAVWATENHLTYFGNGETDGSAPVDELGYLDGESATVQDNSGLEKTGYSFDGWNTQADGQGTSVAVGSTLPFTGSDQELYAVWSLNHYGVTYLANNGTSDSASQTLDYGDTTALNFANPFSYGGHTFVGWATSSTATSALGSLSVSQATTLYAVWSTNSYTISYRKNDGTFTSTTRSTPWGSTNALSFSSGWTRPGYTFVGWATTAGATTAASSYTVNGTATLYAVWHVASAATLTAFADVTKSVTLGHFDLTPVTTNSTGSVTYSLNCPGVATLSGRTVTLVAAGTCVVSASVAAVPDFGAASTQMTLTVTPAVVYVPATTPSTSEPAITNPGGGTVSTGYQKSLGKVVVTSNGNGNAVDDWSLSLQGQDSTRKPLALDAGNRLSAAAGGKAVLAGAGYLPNTSIVVYVDGVQVGTVTTTAQGTFALTVSLSPQLAKGVHAIQIAGVSKSNQARTATAALVIAGVTKISVTRAVYFLGDSPKITAKTGDVLRALRDLLKNKKNITVTVTGWVKETAKKDHDLKLSADRAANIVFVLRQLFHVNAVYNYVGKGISPENTDKSRRADILVTYTN